MIICLLIASRFNTQKLYLLPKDNYYYGFIITLHPLHNGFEGSQLIQSQFTKHLYICIIIIYKFNRNYRSAVQRFLWESALKSANNLGLRWRGPSEDTVCLSVQGHQGCLIDLYSLFRPWLHTAQKFCREMSTSCACSELCCHFILQKELMKWMFLGGLMSCWASSFSHRFEIWSRKHIFYISVSRETEKKFMIFVILFLPRVRWEIMPRSHLSAGNWKCGNNNIKTCLPTPLKLTN